MNNTKFSMICAGLMLGLMLPAQAGDKKAREDAMSRIDAGEVDEAAENLGKHRDTEKHSVAWYQEAAHELLEQARIEQAARNHEASRRAGEAAVKLLKQALKRNEKRAGGSDVGQLHLDLAQVYETILGDEAQARKEYQLALKEMPDSERVKQELARFAAKDEHFERIKGRKK